MVVPERQPRDPPTPYRDDDDDVPLMSVSLSTPQQSGQSAQQPWSVGVAVPDEKTTNRPRRRCCSARNCLLLFVGVLFGFIFAKATTESKARLPKALVQHLPSLSTLKEHLRIPHFPSSSPNADRVVVTMRTGSSVLNSRLPPHLDAFSSRRPPRTVPPQLVIYSDWEVQLDDGWHVRNALANVSDTIRRQEDFQAYAELRRVIEENGRVEEFRDGHKLDKYKFMPLWNDAFRSFPDADWYIGTEDDSFIFYKPLLKLLSTLDPTAQHFLGCTNYLVPSNELFANGGCSYVFSRALLAATFGSSPAFVDSADGRIENSCCGDGELGVSIFHHASVSLKSLSKESRQRFTGAAPWKHWYDEANWCEPIVSLHHLDAWSTRKLYRFAPENDTVRFVDIHDIFQPSFLSTNKSSTGSKTARRTSWVALDGEISPRVLFPLSNLTTTTTTSGGGGGSGAARTPSRWTSDLCSGACQDDTSCFVWTLFPPGSASASNKSTGDCYLLRNATAFGYRTDERGQQKGHSYEPVESGWMLARFQEWRAKFWCSAGRYTPIGQEELYV
ncbi:uncharacterized protein PFL1_01065 [Pseudozyma flocculosa PF-1]|uniref:uncharacterized protein n=1 Tax=Pseudozyma flocculosa PF-1 TaxID=1277687 RepID=UPI000456174D|nr:uncharacterized protein PFL1_01065 [Pseudozyma flocculosa PF-1]EPQ31732.1 hypothetical protein PFL1_01065 [Pseudozyma flocculosa PF-1]